MKQHTKKQAFSTCTLKELCPEDKQKVAQLVKQVVELGKENQQLKAAATKAAAAEEKLRQIQECNKEAVKENGSLKNKLGQAVTVLRMYHHKVQGLDAALRALQHSATSSDELDAQQQQQQEEQQQQQHLELQQRQPLLPLPQQQQPQTQPHPTPPASSNAEQFTSKPISKEQLMTANAANTPAPAASAAGQPAQLPASRKQHSSEQHPAGAVGSPARPDWPSSATATAAAAAEPRDADLHSLSGSAGALPAPSLSPSSAERAVTLPGAELQHGSAALGPVDYASLAAAPLQGLTVWQLQQGMMVASPEGQASRQWRVLQFDPSIGSHGAFVVQEPPEAPLPVMDGGLPAALAAETTAAAKQAAMQASVSPVAAAAVGSQQQGQLLLPAPPPPTLAMQASVPGFQVQQQQAFVPPAAAAAASGALPGAATALGDCIPWQDGNSPTGQQLFDLAKTFDSLALATRSSTAAGSLPITPASSPEPRGLVGVVNDGSVGPMVALQQHAALQERQAAAAGGSGSACAQGGCLVKASCRSSSSGSWVCGQPVSVSSGPALAEAVEEVAVEDLDVAQLPVLICNEKSASRLQQDHQAASSSPTARPPMAPSAAAPAGTRPQVAHPEQAPLVAQTVPVMQAAAAHGSMMWLGAQHSWVGSSASPAAAGQDQAPTPAPLASQACTVHAPVIAAAAAATGVEHAQQQSSSRMQGLEAAMPPAWPGPAASHRNVSVCGGQQFPQEAWVGQHHQQLNLQALQQQQQQMHELQHQLQQPLMHSSWQPHPQLQPQLAGSQPQQPSATSAQQVAQVGVGTVAAAGNGHTAAQANMPEASRKPRRGCWEEAASCGGAAGSDCGTLEVLQKFDESLVDILSEVERLEQQQRRLARHRLQQQQQQQHSRWRQQPLGQENLAASLQQQQHCHLLDKLPRPSQHVDGRADLLQELGPNVELSRQHHQQQHSHLEQRKQMLQQRMLHLQQEALSMAPHGRPWQQHCQQQERPWHTGPSQWCGQGDPFLDDDDVSDILNQLD